MLHEDPCNMPPGYIVQHRAKFCGCETSKGMQLLACSCSAASSCVAAARISSRSTTKSLSSSSSSGSGPSSGEGASTDCVQQSGTCQGAAGCCGLTIPTCCACGHIMCARKQHHPDAQVGDPPE